MGCTLRLRMLLEDRGFLPALPSPHTAQAHAANAALPHTHTHAPACGLQGMGPTRHAAVTNS